MSQVRHTFFAPPIISSDIAALYTKACSKEEAPSLNSADFIKIFAEHYHLDEEVFDNEFIENQILRHGCLMMSEDKRNMFPQKTTDTFWHADKTAGKGAEWFFVFFYRLSQEQCQEIVDAYNKKYGEVAQLAEKDYENATHTILFNKARFCQLVLPHMAAQYQPQMEDRCHLNKPINLF